MGKIPAGRRLIIVNSGKCVLAQWKDDMDLTLNPLQFIENSNLEQNVYNTH